MGAIGDLLERRSGLLTELARIRALMTTTSNRFTELSALLNGPDARKFANVGYPANGWGSGTMVVVDNSNYPTIDALIQSHQRYAEVSRELAQLEQQITQAGGKW